MSIPEIQLVRNYLDKVRYITRQLMITFSDDKDTHEILWKIDNWTESALNNLIDVDTYILYREKDVEGLLDSYEELEKELEKWGK